jgi:succinylglutamate desuccinylase
VRGEIVAAAGNLPALEAGRRYLSRDLNRLWTRDVVHRVLDGDVDESVPEEGQLAELLGVIHAAVDRARGPVLVLDLHTASASTSPFAILGDTLRNRRFAAKFPAPIVLGLEEQLVGTLMEYVTAIGHVSLAFEAGQHDDPRSIDRHEAAVWLALTFAGCVRRQNVPAWDAHFELLRGSRRGLPRFLEIIHRHPVEPEDRFVMRPGYRNFHPVKRGEHLATDRDGPILSPGALLLFLPLYQGLGSDGFFLARQVNPVWLELSSWLRRTPLPSLVPLLPGVRRHPEMASTLLVDRHVARFLAPQVFHLLGYRVRAGDGLTYEVRRRRES